MLWCIMVCSMIGGLSVSTTTGLGGAIVTSIYLHDNQVCRCVDASEFGVNDVIVQFKYFFIYILLVFVTVTLRKCCHSELSVVPIDTPSHGSVLLEHGASSVQYW